MAVVTANTNVLVKVRTVVLDDSSNIVGAGTEEQILASDLFANTPATTLAAGSVKQAVFIAQVAVPFADLTAAATAHNALLTALKDAGVMKPTA